MKLTTQDGYRFGPLCKICRAKDKHGMELRPEVEQMKASGAKKAEIQAFLNSHGIYASLVSIGNHFKNHALYLQHLPSKATARLITTVTHQTADSRRTIEKIISSGSEMIDNWWRAIHGQKGYEDLPKMPVSEKLFIEAMKEEGRRAPRTAIDTELDNMEKELIEGEEVRDAQISASH